MSGFRLAHSLKAGTAGTGLAISLLPLQLFHLAKGFSGTKAKYSLGLGFRVVHVNS